MASLQVFLPSRKPFFWAACLVVCSLDAGLNLAEADDEVSYVDQVQPILVERCGDCHGEDTQESDLRLDLAAGILVGGNVGPAIVPGNAEKSLLWHVIRGKSELVPRMPPEDYDDPLSDEEIETIRRWIEQGAPHPESESQLPGTRRESDHWSFQPIDRPAVPKLSDPAYQLWSENPLDAFVWRRLAEEGIRPSPPADRVTLMRRVYLDLLGLPPTPLEIEAFVQDDRPDSYERLVDRLLASPHYGERWGRYWLDQARYADSDGYTNDVARVMWKYRDWVIDAFNRDLPFDQFTTEQLAGDLLPNPTAEQIIATGFHRNTQHNREGGSDPEQYRVEAVVDRVSTTGVVFLGLTLGCARCHDHKYDPVSQRDFYEMFAFLNNQDEPKYTVNLDLPEAQQLKDAKAELVDTRKTLYQYKEQAAKEKLAEWEAILQQESPQWQIVKPQKVSSRDGSKFEELPDQSVLVKPSTTGKDVYTAELTVEEGGITAVRLEVLTHEKLPGGGPGLASNGNFILHEFQVERLAASSEKETDETTPVEIGRTLADHSQKGYPIADAIDNDASTGWAINVEKGDLHQDRSAWFVLKEPLGTTDQPLRLKLSLQQLQDSYLLGRIRFAVTRGNPDAVGGGLSQELEAILAKPAEKRTTKEKDQLLGEFLRRDARHNELTQRVSQLEQRVKKLSEIATTTTLVMRERAQPRDTYVHIRGDFLRKGRTVGPDVPDVLPPLEEIPSAESDTDKSTTSSEIPDRLDLAQWLVDSRNPLTARVTVNRIWQQFFGRGIVETENDFGAQGSLPTHPDLLDYLAVRFRDDGWSVKSLHRLIVTSATYRQSSVYREELHSIDPRNELLARQNRLRLEAEIIRDNALAASGLLSKKLKGPSVFPPQPEGVMKMTRNPNRRWVVSPGADRYRRGMYTYFWRSTPHPFLKLFNAPESNTTCTRRDRSNTPLQALTLLNDEAFVEAARALAARVLHELPQADQNEQIRYLFRLCLARTPNELEVSALKHLLDEELKAARDAMDSSSAAEVGVPQSDALQFPSELSAAEAVAWTSLARTMLNLDEFITRE